MAIAAIIDIIFIVLTVTSPITYASASTASTQTLGLGLEQFQGRRGAAPAVGRLCVIAACNAHGML